MQDSPLTSLTHSIKEDHKEDYNRVTAANASIELDLNITIFIDIN